MNDKCGACVHFNVPKCRLMAADAADCNPIAEACSLFVPDRADLGGFSLAEFQREQQEWADRNFGEKASLIYAFMGMVEEVGELAHALLKADQGIRGSNAEHVAEARDAIGDLMVFTAQVCNRMGWDLEKVIQQTWAEVRQRDWKKFPKNGRTE